MGDVVVTVSKNFEYYDPKTKRDLVGIEGWIAEGDAAGEPWSGEEWYFTLGGYAPHISKGDRVYVVHNGKLRGYAPLVRVEKLDYGYALVRGGGAVAVTIDESIVGFRGYRYRWWKYEQERPFPDWQIP
jgi:hypothetical protein